MEDYKQKLIVFSNDRALNKAVYDFLLKEFLDVDIKQDVNMLASAYLAVDFLRKGFQKIDNLANNDPDNRERPGPVGL